MKKFTEKELRDFLNEEIKKAIISEGFIEEISEEPKKEIEEVKLEDVKMMAEEIKRMKELIDFRSPLLKKD